MQLKKLSPLAGLILTALLGACGGKGDEPPPPAPAPPPPAITVSAISLSSTSPATYANNVLQFDGGVCGGGTGTLTASWDFDDGTGAGTPNTHTYAEAKTGSRTVKVTCSDTAGTTPQFSTLSLNIQSEAMKGFLGKTWSAYSAIESNVSPYPVAGIAQDTGNIYGVWVRRNATNVNEVAAGSTSFSLSTWNVSGVLPTLTDTSPYDDSYHGKATAPIDIAVSPNGSALAAWKAGTVIWYATRSPTTGTWSAPQPTISAPVTNGSIKVVVNNLGNGAIAYCTSTGASVITYIGGTVGTTAQPISKKCGGVDTDHAFQRQRAFDIAIDSGTTIYAVGVNAAPAPNATLNSVVTLQSYSGTAWTTTPTAISDELANAKAPNSLSYSRSPNGHAVIAWDQQSPTSTLSNVYFSMSTNGTVWSTAAPVRTEISPTTNYASPLIAVNDDGDAFLAMRMISTTSTYSTVVSNYDAIAAAWSASYQTDASGFEHGMNATDIAIDKYGTGLITQLDGNDHYTQAGTFAKKPGLTQWSGYKTISTATPDTAYYKFQTFHYQTMRALPDGRAILVTSVYDDKTPNTGGTTPVLSGYMLLK